MSITHPFFVVNPRSANGATHGRFAAMLPLLRQAWPSMDFAWTAAPLDAVRLTQDAIRAGADVIVACGGDGTLNEVVTGIHQWVKASNSAPAPHLAILPSGTGGDFRRTFDLPRAAGDFIAGLRAEHVRRVDMGELTFRNHQGDVQERPFVNVASMGLSGLVVHYVNRSSKALGGRWSFMVGSLRASLSYRNVDMTVTVDDRVVHQGPTVVVAIANGRYFGGGMQIAPGAEPDDGWLDIVVIGDLSRLGMWSLARAIYSGRHLTRKGVTAHRGRNVTVTSTTPAKIDCDGEQIGQLPVQARILPRHLTLLVPATGDSYS